MGQIQVEVRQVGPSTGKGTARSHSVLIDRPVPKGGEDRGPLGGELLLLALGGCFLSNFLAAVRARSAAISDVRIVVSATVGGSPERVEAFALDVAARYEDDDLMGKLVEIAERGCLVTNTLKKAADVTVRFGGVVDAA